jgi:probable F420-dependent oxidoreductase
MEIGFGAPVSGAWATSEAVARVAARAEGLGYHSVWTFQRLLVGVGQELDPVYRSVLDPLLTLTYAAAYTSRIRLGVAVVNLPFVSPTHLAKQAGTLDVLSGGRLDLGLGTGWSDVEFIATGATTARRAARTQEFLAVLRTLWADEVSAFDGEFYTVPPSVMAPRPVQPGGPPVLLGGRGARARRGGARLAAGWVSSSRASLDDIARGARIVREAAADAGRDPDSIRIVCRGVVEPGERRPDRPLSGSWQQIRAGADELAGHGVTELFYDLNWDPLIGSPDVDPAAALHRAEEIMSALAPSS